MTIPPFITKAVTNYYRFLAIGIAVILVVAGYALVISPKITDVQSVQLAAKKDAEADLKAKQDYVAALRESNAKFTTLLPQASLDRINAFIPTDADFPGLLLTVNNIVSQAQLSLDDITVGQGGQVAVAGTASSSATTSTTGTPAASAATISGVNLKTQDVTISVSGGSSYDNFKQLLSLFESSQRLFDIVSVSYQAGASESNSSTQSTTWNLVLRTYYLPAK